MNLFHGDFVPLALVNYGGTSEKFEKLLEKITSKAAEFNNIPYPILLNYWKKRISAVFNLEMFSSFQRLTVAYSTLERRLYNVIMI